VKYPDNIRTKKAKAIYWFYKQIYVFERGKGDVIGRFTGYFQESAILAILLKVFGISLTWYMWVLFFVGMVILCYIIGYFYIRYGLDQINNLISQERNPVAHEVYNKLCENKEELCKK
jgi:hypothetical protein